jgi:hypothetical protein
MCQEDVKTKQGELVSITNPIIKGKTTLTYDKNGVETKVNYPNNGLEESYTFDVNYNLINNQAQYHKETNRLLENQSHIFIYEAYSWDVLFDAPENRKGKK